MNPRASAPRMRSGVARPRPVREQPDRLGEVLGIGDERHEVLEDDPLGREVRDVADPVAQVECHAGALHGRPEVADEEEVRELLGDARERLEVVERVLPALGVARAQSRCDELLDECCLAPRARQERPEMPRVDAEPSEPRACGGDVGLALAVEALAALRARDDEPELLELAHDVRRRRMRARTAPFRRSPPRGRARRRSCGACDRSLRPGRRAPRGSRGAAGTRRAEGAGSS